MVRNGWKRGLIYRRKRKNVPTVASINAYMHSQVITNSQSDAFHIKIQPTYPNAWVVGCVYWATGSALALVCLELGIYLVNGLHKFFVSFRAVIAHRFAVLRQIIALCDAEAFAHGISPCRFLVWR